MPNIMLEDVPNRPLDYYTCQFKKSKLSRWDAYWKNARLTDVFISTQAAIGTFLSPLVSHSALIRQTDFFKNHSEFPQLSADWLCINLAALFCLSKGAPVSYLSDFSLM